MASVPRMASAGEPDAGRPVVVVVGLGPAGAELTTPQAQAALSAAPAVLCRTARHPAAEPWLERGAVALDRHYETAASFEATYAGIVEEVVETARRHGEVAYAVPGSPLVLEQTVAALLADPRVLVRLVPGMSFLDLAWARLGLDPVERAVRLVDAQRFAAGAAGDRGPLLVAHLWCKPLASEVKLAVETFPDRPVTVLHHLGLADEAVFELAWEDLDRGFEPDHLTCCYVPELAAPVAAELVALDEVVHVLRERCPWDAEQTHASLARHLIEEAYEAVEAIDHLGEHPSAADAAAAAHLEEELGDVLCQVVLHSVLAAEEGLFDLADVARGIHDKLVHRHPNVFGAGAGAGAAAAAAGGGAAAAGAAAAAAGAAPGSAPPARAQEAVWERLKQEEKGRQSLTEGIPPALPALAFAAKLESRARSAGLALDAVLGAVPATPAAGDPVPTAATGDPIRRRRLVELAGWLDAPLGARAADGDAPVGGEATTGEAPAAGEEEAPIDGEEAVGETAADETGAETETTLGVEAVLGALLLDLARLAADRRVEPEQALRRALGRWQDRIRTAEAQARAAGAALSDLAAEERRTLWRSAGAD